MRARLKFQLLFFALTLSWTLLSQNPARFRNEVHKLIAGDSAINKENLILFTGSSSIRLWTTLESDFDNKNVLNRGFGGSVMTDLAFYIDTLITPYKPIQVFIYEGDNDISSGKQPDDVVADAIKLARAIKDRHPDTHILFISPKPSLSRWNLKDQYELYNAKLKSWIATQKEVSYVDVWTPMLDASGSVQNDLFVEDGLHMNKKGYEIWRNAVEPFLKK